MTAGEITPGAGPVAAAPAGPDAASVRHSLLGCVLFPLASLLVTLLIAAGAVRGWSPGAAAILALVFFSVHVVLVLRRAEALDPVIWVPVAMLMFYFATPLALALNEADATLSYDTWDMGMPQNLSAGYFMALVTLLSFLGGVHLAGLAKGARRAEAPAAVGTQIQIPCLVIAMGGFSMMMVGIVLVGPSLLFGFYGDLWYAKAAGLDVRLLEVGFLFCQGAALGLLASAGRGHPLAVLFGVGLSGFLVLYSLLTGDRAALISFGLPAAWVFSKVIRRISWTPVLVAAFIGLLLMPVIKEYREVRRVDATARSSLRSLVVGTLYETGSTVQVFGHTMDQIPRYRSYDYGLSVVYSVLNLVPNFGLSAGKDFLPDPLVHHPSTWLTYTLNPAKWAEGGGYGFAIGAEWYFNFGLAGVFLGMGLVGFLFTLLRNRAMRSPLLLMTTASLFLTLLLLVRNATSAPLKVGLWAIAGVLILRFLFGFVGVGRQRKPPGQMAPIP